MSKLPKQKAPKGRKTIAQGKERSAAALGSNAPQNPSPEGAGELPLGWEITTIENLISPDGIFVDGDWVESKDQDPNGEVRLIQLADIGDGVFQNKSSRFLTKQKAKQLRCTYLNKGDVLVARMPDPLGRSCIFPLEGSEMFVTVVDVCIIRTSENISSPEFLRSAINYLGTRKQIEELQTGTTRKRISRKNLATVQIPLPPLNEQKRIVAKIEELFSELDAGEESLRRARHQLGIYRQSLLKQAFEGKLTAHWRTQNPGQLESPPSLTELIDSNSERAKFRSERKHKINGWSYRCLDELTEFVTSGSRGWADYYSDSGSLFIRAQNLNRDFLNLDDIAFVKPPASAEGRRTMVKFGDLLITITGANTTKSGWVNTPLEDAYVSQHVALCRPVSEELSPFLYRYIVSEAGGRKQLTKDAYGAGKPGLNLDNVRSLEVPLCSLPEQQEIVRLLDEQFEAIAQNEREIDAALKRSEALRQSILKRAFTGHLVPQDPADEPAPTLLARIQAERSAAK
ncbi:MAG TPA: restriction endonuclease subunit S [Bacteroidia bacterium]|nr:restriction endonuclease subunit S [Bacteroidia bacterium]